MVPREADNILSVVSFSDYFAMPFLRGDEWPWTAESGQAAPAYPSDDDYCECHFQTGEIEAWSEDRDQVEYSCMVCGGLKWWIDLGEWRARRIMRGMNPDVRPGGREEPA